MPKCSGLWALPLRADAAAVRWADLDEIPNLVTPAYSVRMTDAFGASPPRAPRRGTPRHQVTLFGYGGESITTG